MKTISFFALFLLLIASPLLVPAQAAPEAVRTKFLESYPRAKQAQWEARPRGFEVAFKVDGYEMEILYAADAQILVAEEGIHPDDLPGDALDYMEETYPGVEIAEAARISARFETYYEAEFMLNGEEKEVVFDERGGYLEGVNWDSEGEEGDVEEPDGD